MQKLKVGDTVEVIAGAERSAAAKAQKRGKVLEIDRRALRATVEGLRLVKKHLKKGRSQANPDGGIIEMSGTIALASIAVVCPKCDKPTRVGIKVAGEERSRYCKRCEATI